MRERKNSCKQKSSFKIIESSFGACALNNSNVLTSIRHFSADYSNTREYLTVLNIAKWHIFMAILLSATVIRLSMLRAHANAQLYHCNFFSPNSCGHCIDQSLMIENCPCIDKTVLKIVCICRAR